MPETAQTPPQLSGVGSPTCPFLSVPLHLAFLSLTTEGSGEPRGHTAWMSHLSISMQGSPTQGGG